METKNQFTINGKQTVDKLFRDIVLALCEADTDEAEITVDVQGVKLTFDLRWTRMDGMPVLGQNEEA